MHTISDEEYQELIEYRRIKEMQVYATEFWKDLSESVFGYTLDPSTLPIIFTNKYLDTYSPGKMILKELYGNCLMIVKITINKELTSSDIKKTINHELIHLALAYKNLKHSDDSAVFKLICDLKNGAAYEALSEFENEIYTKSVDMFNEMASLVEQRGKCLGASLGFSMFLDQLGSKNLTNEKELIKSLYRMSQIIAMQKTSNNVSI